MMCFHICGGGMCKPGFMFHRSVERLEVLFEIIGLTDCLSNRLTSLCACVGYEEAIIGLSSLLINPLSTDGHYSGHLAKFTFLRTWPIWLLNIHYPNFKEFIYDFWTYQVFQDHVQVNA